MGMFDELKCEYPLPLPCPESVFQTKDLGRFLDWYYITKDGKLEYQDYEFQETPEEKRDELGLPIGKKVPTERVAQNYTGSINFYTSGETPDEWYEYCALFKHGQLLEIVSIAHPDLPENHQ